MDRIGADTNEFRDTIRLCDTENGKSKEKTHDFFFFQSLRRFGAYAYCHFFAEK